ncbi:sodium:proton antiporter [Desertihabitans brevis]|uniref:Sodium:proton antiporter n=1 Tax=Desertihabitans brevis TaxID=2268447 RepID=A0A367YUE7_9ACTN|nr:cation:proton antiporter [Desertihabitans brevis]RCK69513.1 sodium:proton antiporter [Desertihabitans brevis]
MTDAFVLVLGVALLAAVLLSGLATRSALSTTAVFLVAGLVVGPLGLGWLRFEGGAVERAAEIALFAVLFTDGQHAPWRVARRAWRLPARALLVGMPLTFVLVALLARYLAGLDWGPALVLGAVLAPTDPVFASALVGQEHVPERVRSALNIESGLNDGLALPAVLLLVGTFGGHPEGFSTTWWVLLAELAAGAGLGVLMPLLVHQLLRLRALTADRRLRPLGPLAMAVVLFGVCDLVHANQFVAAFVAGAVVATLRPDASEEFKPTGELVSELTKGAALVCFATLIDWTVLGEAGWISLLFAVLVLVVTRPVPTALAMLGSELTARGRVAVGWFGPKGFASVAYAVIVSGSGMPGAEEVLAFTAVVVLVSALAHSSTDVAVARWWDDPRTEPVRSTRS